MPEALSRHGSRPGVREGKWAGFRRWASWVKGPTYLGRHFCYMCDVECASLSSSGGFRKEKVRAGGSRGKVAGKWRFVLVFLRSGEVGSRFKCWSQRDFRGRSNRSPPLLGLTKRSLGGPVFFRGQRSNETACRVFTRDL